MRFALTRELSDGFEHCELTHLQRLPIDLDRARDQHADYCALLKQLGCHVITLPGESSMPDCVFVEDPAIVLDEVAVMTRPGVKSRRPEGEAIEQTLADYRRIERIIAPGTLEGGDIIVNDKIVYIGRSSRSNEDGIIQLAALIAPYGYSVKAVTMTDCLHLKSGASVLNGHMMLVNRDWIDAEAFEDVELIDIHPEEPRAANCLQIGDTVIHQAAFPKTSEILNSRGFQVRSIDYDELAKAESGLTCCSLIYEADWKPRLVE